MVDMKAIIGVSYYYWYVVKIGWYEGPGTRWGCLGIKSVFMFFFIVIIGFRVEKWRKIIDMKATFLVGLVLVSNPCLIYVFIVIISFFWLKCGKKWLIWRHLLEFYYCCVVKIGWYAGHVTRWSSLGITCVLCFFIVIIDFGV